MTEEVKDPYRTRQSLIERVKNPNDELSWEEFIQSYHPFIIYLLKQLGVTGPDVDDFSQKIIVKCWEKIDTFTCSGDRGKFRAWLKTMIRHEIFNDRKRKTMIQKKLQTMKIDLDKVEENKIDELIEEEWNVYISNQAWKNIEDKIKPTPKKAFLMFLDGKSTEEISKTLDVNPSTLYTYKKRVKDQLKIELQKLMELYAE